MEKKIKITSLKQFETLISELENKPSLAKGFHRGSTPSNFKQDWADITLKLNSVGPPIRDSDGWQKVWRDFKCKVKKKLVHNKAEVNATGGGRFKQLTLSPLEEAAANLMQFQKQLNPEGEVQGFPVVVVDEIATDLCDLNLVMLEDDENLPATPACLIQKPESSNKRKRNETRKNDKRNELLENHNAMQKEGFKEISNTMTEIKNVLKETNRYQRKLWEVEEKKLKIMEKQHRREEQLFETEIKLKKIKMEIKSKELEILKNQYQD